MAYLRINGYTVKVRQGHELSLEEIQQHRQYSPNGFYQYSRSGIGRAWQMTTPPLPRDEAVALIGMLTHQGDGWAWDTSSAGAPSSTTADFYTDKKRAASTLSSAPTLITPRVAADGAPVYDWNSVASTPFTFNSSGALAPTPACTNLLTADESNGVVGAYTAVGTTPAVLATESSRYWNGAASTKVTCTLTNDGAQTALFNTLGSTRHVFTAYVRGNAGSEQVKVFVTENDGSATTSSTAKTLPATTNAWTRVQHIVTTQAGTTQCRMSVRSNNGAMVFFIDGLLAEAQALYGASPWVAGATTRNASNVEYPIDWVTTMTNGLTANVWVNPRSFSRGANSYIVRVGTASNQEIIIYLSTGDLPSGYVSTAYLGASSALIVQGSAVSTGGWRMYTVVFNQATSTLAFYTNGALAGTDNTWSATGTLDVATLTGNICVGDNGGASLIAPGPIGPMQIYPFAAPAAIVSGWYNCLADGIAPGHTPLACYGDFLHTGEKWLACYGEVTSVVNAPYANSGTWEPGAMAVGFTLREATAR